MERVAQPARLAAGRQVEDIDLLGLVAFALGGEGDAVAVRRPGDAVLRRLGVGDASAAARFHPPCASQRSLTALSGS